MVINKLKIYLIFLICLLAVVHVSFSQDFSFKEKFDEFRNDNYQEKIYVTTDRELYLAGELLWFKVYCLDASMHQYSELSKVAYVELIGMDSSINMQVKVPLNDGVGSGSYQLPTNMISGKYQIRGYTRWMRNYDPAFFFRKKIEIVNSFRRMPVREEYNEGKVDIQFFPEGGDLVAGLESKVAFKGTDEYGKGIDFTGHLINFVGDTVKTFRPSNLGMGSFLFKPDKGEEYHVSVEHNGKTKRVNFPVIKEGGFILRLEESDNEVILNVRSSQSIRSFYLLAHARNMVFHSDRYLLNDGKMSIFIKKQDLVEGINHFTIFDESNIPVCERLYFKIPAETLDIAVTSDHKTYSKREKITLDIQADRDENSNLSVSVFKLDSLNKIGNQNIVNYLYLTSDLKGIVERPDYYFSHEAKVEDFDLLMLTHGWRRFVWNDILDGDNDNFKRFIPERYGHLFTGKLVDNDEKTVAANTYCYLSVPGRIPQFYNTKADLNGNFVVETNDLFGSVDVIASANQEIDSNLTIKVDNPFSDELFLNKKTPFEINKNLSQSIVHRSVGMQALNIYQKADLNSYKLPRSDSTMFYGKPDHTYYLDDYTRFPTMEDVMREYVPSVWVRKKSGDFYFKILDAENLLVYDKGPLVLYDGVPIFDVNQVMELDPLKIRKLEVVSRRYFYKNEAYEGIVSYTSYDGDLAGYQVDPRSVILEYKGLQIEREFYSPNYDLEQSQRIPDFRNLLFWSPEIVTDQSGVTSVEFFSSDNAGKFIVVVEGLSKDGKPGFTTYTFEVKGEVN